MPKRSKAARKKRTRRVIFALVACVVLLIVLALVAARFIGNNNNGEEVDIATAEIRTITQTVTASGRVQPEVEIVISPDVSGEIVELPVEEGQMVRRNQLLARIKPDFYRAQVEQAEANLSQTKAQEAQRRADLLMREQDLTRQKQLFEAEVIAQEIYEQSNTQFEIAQAALEAAQFAVESSEARLKEVREQLSKTALYAPMDGTVSKLEIELGERVTGNELQAGTTVMTIARLDQMEIEVEVSENDVVNVALGDTAKIEVDAYPERSFRGVVTEIANSARLQGGSFQEQVTNFPVKVRILDPHNLEAYIMAQASGQSIGETVIPDDAPAFRPGMSGTVDIFTKTVSQVVAIPIQSVSVRDFAAINRRRARLARQTSDSVAVDSLAPTPAASAFGQREQLRKMVFVVGETDRVEAVEVETGIADDRFIEVTSGLADGTRVVQGPYSAVSRTLDDGDLVRERTGFVFERN